MLGQETLHIGEDRGAQTLKIRPTAVRRITQGFEQVPTGQIISAVAVGRGGELILKRCDKPPDGARRQGAGGLDMQKLHHVCGYLHRLIIDFFGGAVVNDAQHVFEHRQIQGY